MPLKLKTPASVLPVSLQEAKLHCRVIADTADMSPHPDDELIEAYIVAATQDAEHLMGRAVMPQKWLLTLDGFAPEIALQRPPVTAIDLIEYFDGASGGLLTLPADAYQLLSGSDYTAAVVPAYGQQWPTTRVQPEAVRITFSCGYGDGGGVPELIKAWIKLRIGSLYANREAWTVGQPIERNEHVDFLLDRYRVWQL